MEKFNNFELYEEIARYIVSNLEDYRGVDLEELHHEIFNMNYYIIGTQEAKDWLNKYGTFEAIEYIKEYENENFGEVITDLSDPEKVANMLAYIIGEELLDRFYYLQDDSLTLEDDQIDHIKGVLKEEYL